jgi:hypothetical protein
MTASLFNGADSRLDSIVFKSLGRRGSTCMSSNAHIFQCVVHWCWSSFLFTLAQGEIYYYHCVDSVPTDLSSILRKCIVKPKVEENSAATLSRTSSTKRPTSNHSPSKSRSRGLQGPLSSLYDEVNGGEDVEHIYYTNRSCHLASNSFYEINWPDFCADKCSVQGDCEGSQWQLDPEKDVKGHKIVRTRNTDIDETSSSESHDSEGEYDKSRKQDSQEYGGVGRE